MDKNLDWDLPTPTGEEATLDPYANTVISAPLPEPEAKTRALKIKLAFSGEESAPSYEEILAEVQTQREDRLKDRLAQSESIRKTYLKQNLIREVVDSGEATPESLSFLQSLSAEEIVDKEGILEKKYAEWRVNMGLSSDESGTVEKVLSENPDGTNDNIDSSVDRLYRFEIAGSAKARAQAKYDQTGIGRTLIDFGFSVLPWAEAQEARNITPDNVNVEGVLPSNVRRSQIRDLYAMPAKEFAATVAQMEKEADEAGDWKPFIQLMQDLEDYSAYRSQVDNAFALVSLAELAPGGIVFDAVRGLGAAGRAGGRAIARSEARRKAVEAVSGAASTPPTGQGAKAAGEAPSPPAAGTAPPGTAQTMATEANAAAGRGQTTVTAGGETATVSSGPIKPIRQKTVKGRETEAFVFNGRIVTMVDVDGVRTPFYISTGSGGKKSVATGRWYPFFGVGPEDDWFNKGTEAQINNYYGSQKLRQAAEYLDQTVGDIRSKGGSLPSGFSRDAKISSWQKNGDDFVDTKGMFDEFKGVNHKDSANQTNIFEHLIKLGEAPSWTVGTKTYTSAREVNAAFQQAMEGQSKRQRLLADEQALTKYAEERGETPEAMRKLLSDNFNDQKARVEKLGKIVNSPEFKAAEAAERKAASNIKFTDKTDKQFNPETGMVEDIPQPTLTEQEVVLSAVAEKASGDPRSLDELAQEIQNSYTIDGRVLPTRPGLLQEFETAALARDIADRKIGEVVTSRNGDTYLIKELTNKEMAEERANGLTPLGFIRFAKDQADSTAHSVFINSEKIASGFKVKWWTKSNGNGFRALPEDTFKTLEEFKTFVIEHELMHIRGEEYTPWRTIANDLRKSVRLEEAVNVNALLKMGKVDAAKKAYPEFFSKRVASGPDPSVVPTPPKVAEVVRPKSYPTPQTIDVPGTQKKYQTLKARIKSLNEEIQKTYPKGSPKSAGIPDKGERRLSLQVQLKTAQEELAKLTSVIDSREYQALVKTRAETAKKIGEISDRLKFPAKHYPKWFKEGAQDTKAWQKEKARLEKELKAEQKKFAQTDRLDLNPKAEVTPNTVSGNTTKFSRFYPPGKMAPDWPDNPVDQTVLGTLHSRLAGSENLGIVELLKFHDTELKWVDSLLASSDEALLQEPALKQFKDPASARKALSVYRESIKDLSPFLADAPHVTVDIPNPATGGTAQVQVPATEENLTKIYLSNVESSGMADMADDTAGLFAAHGDIERAAVAKALESPPKASFKDRVKETSKALFDKLPSIYDISEVIIGKPAHNSLKKLANNLAETYRPIIERQKAIGDELWKVFEETQSMGALRWSDEVFEAVKDIAVAQTKKTLRTPASAILNLTHRREWQSFGRTNQVVYALGSPDGRLFTSPQQATVFAKDQYGLVDGTFSIRSIRPDAFFLEVAKVVDETDPDILKLAIQTDTKTPMSFVNTFVGYLRSPGEMSSETLRQNFRVSTHHAKRMHEAFVTAAQDIGKMSKKEMQNLEALMEAKRDVEKVVIDPLTGQQKKVRGEWFNSAQELEKVYKKAFGNYPSENVVSAYFTMRQMYDFDLLHRNLRLFTEKARKGFKVAKPYVPIPDDRNPGMVRWVQMKKGFEVKVLDELPEGNVDVLVLDSERAQAHYFKTAKAGKEGVQALQAQGYKLLQVMAPNQLPLKNTKNEYVNVVLTKDVTIEDLTPNQIPATEGGHIRYNEGFYLKQPKYTITESGEKLHTGDQTITGFSSEAEAAQRMADYDTGRQLLKAGDIQGLVAHLRDKIPMTVGQFEQLFRPTLGRKGEIIEEPLLDIDTPIVWVRDGQGTNDAARTHAPQLKSSFDGVRDTIDDPLNEMSMINKKYTGEKDFILDKITEQDGILQFQKARMISPLETLEQAWAEIARNIATDNMKIQASTNWVEEAAEALLTPIEQLRRNPWEALNNPQWNTQYGDMAKIRTLNTQRLQILNFLAQRDSLGSTLDWMRNKLLSGVYNYKGQAAADWVDDHLLPNVRNPLAFMRSFAFHTKMGFFNPIQLFLQSNTMINTWAITGNVQRVGSALSGVTLMQMSRVNRTPEVLAALSKKSEKLGWNPGEWMEMDEMFHRLSLHIVEGEIGTLDVMTNPKMFKGVGGMFLDKALVFFREGERAVRMNAFAVAYKEFRDKFPQKVITNADENRILSRMEVLAATMTRADNALWQKGLTGPMTQFWGYQARIMEQLLGKQLTRAEKLRLGTAFAAMYGIPVSLAATTMFQIPGWSTDDIRQYALENNIDVNSGPLSVAMNGIPAELIRWMTSDENGQGGLLLGIGDRYGPGGLPTIRNLIEAKDGVADAVIDLAFGASGSITRDFFKHILPDDWDIVDSAVNAPQLTLVDYANMFSTISTVNNGTKLWWAIQTHRNMTKDGLDLGDKTPLSAWVSFLTGLEEQRFKDTFLKMDSLKDLRGATEELGKEYIRQIKKAKLLPVGSEERARRVKKARALLEGMDPKDVKKYLKQAYRSGDGLEQSIDRSFKQKFKE